ncbi:SpoIIE family protein phosphatase [Streptomyces sp. NBC_00669]|uniref:SpoIIE family protein phosphatase n=1 Tax=unclassified Streptomyces TaxID=2593676 RepID=UPI002E354AC3|nr:SpoIIE family protein phosphatase [Streptomyces sp. NBC_00669]
MPDSGSFSFDARGRVTAVRSSAQIPPAALTDAVGESALHVLRDLLEASETDGTPVVQFDAWRSDEGTVLSAVGSAASPGTARVQSAYMPSAFENAVAGLELYDIRQTVVRSNAACLAVRGLPADDVVGHRVEELDSTLPLSPLVGRAMSEERAAGASPVVVQDVRKGPEVYSVLALPLREGTDVVGAATIMHNVTESVRSRDAERLLVTMHKKLGTELGVMQTAQELASAATEEFADVVSVDLAEALFHGEEAPLPPLSATSPLRRAAFVSVTEFTSLYAVGEPSRFAFPTPYSQALADTKPRLVDPRSSPSDWHMHDAARAGILRSAGVHSMILAPLVQRGRVLGLACFYRAGRDTTPFDRHDLALAEQITARAAVHMENARRYTRELNAATTLQRRLLPQRLPQVPAVRTAYFWNPSRHQTHWFDVIPLSGARVGLAMGQIPQHGLRASVDIGRFRTAFATLARMDLAPDELLAHLDDVTHTIQQEDAASPEARADNGNVAGPAAGETRCLYAIYDPIAGGLALASADWPAPLVTTADGVTTPIEVPLGPALGHHSSYETARTTLAPDTLLTFYSASMLHPPGDDDALALLRRAAGRSAGDAQVACDNIVYALMGDRVGGARDGGAVLTAEVRRLAPDDHVSWTSPRERAAVADCRARAREQLEAWRLEDQVFATEMVVSELVTNVLQHAGGKPRVRLIRDEHLTVEVSDDSTTSPHLRHARAQDEGGRGLLIAATLASRWGTRYGEEGKTIWVEQDLPEEGPR